MTTLSENDLYYLRSIQRQLQMVKESLDDSIGLSLGVMAFADNLNWLDCFIDEHERRNAAMPPAHHEAPEKTGASQS